MAIPDLRFKTGSISLKSFEQGFLYVSRRSQAPVLQSHPHRQILVLAQKHTYFSVAINRPRFCQGERGCRKVAFNQVQQQTEHLGHCNIAEMHFKTLSQSIKTMILRESRD